MSLFSGAGGLDLGFQLAVPNSRVVMYNEIETTAIAVLLARIQEGKLDDAPIWTDVKSLDGRPWRGAVDFLLASYPCQPFSNAGKRLGSEDPRHLWPEVARIVREIEPRFCFFENVGAHLRVGGHEVIRELQSMGYRTAAVLLTASEIGAPHGRERLFILADRHEQHDNGSRDAGTRRRDESADSGSELANPDLSSGSPSGDESQNEGWTTESDHESTGVCSGLGDTDIPGLEGWGESERSSGYELPAWPPGPKDDDGWRRVLAVRPDLAPALSPEREIRYMANGVARGMDLSRGDQLHILGNGVVPPQAAYAFAMLADALGVE